jgi:DNA-directed RNA polymerase specialized sigma subunit
MVLGQVSIILIWRYNMEELLKRYNKNKRDIYNIELAIKSLEEEENDINIPISNLSGCKVQQNSRDCQLETDVFTRELKLEHHKEMIKKYKKRQEEKQQEINLVDLSLKILSDKERDILTKYYIDNIYIGKIAQEYNYYYTSTIYKIIRKSIKKMR